MFWYTLYYCSFIKIHGHSFFVDLMKIAVLRICKFVDDDHINTICYQLLHFNGHLISWINLSTNQQKLLFSKFWWNQSIISLRTVSTNFGLEVKINLTSDACFVRIPGSIIWLWLQVEGQAMLGQSMNSSLQKSWRPMVIPVSQLWSMLYFKQKLIGKF